MPTILYVDPQSIHDASFFLHAAADLGLFDYNAYSRREMTGKKGLIPKHQEQTLNRTSLDFPWICPTEAENQIILDASLEWERELMPDMDDEEGLRESFQRTLDKKKLCVLDVKATVEMEEWKAFFRDFQ